MGVVAAVALEGFRCDSIKLVGTCFLKHDLL
jgi:hypothetical protein